MEKYISEFHRDISDDMSRRILPKAVHVCAQMFLSIEVDSPSLMSIPPAMFRAIINGLDVDVQQKTLHSCSLIAAYLERNVEDMVVVDFCCDAAPIDPWLTNNLDVSEDASIELALTWFRLFAKYGLNDFSKLDDCGYYGTYYAFNGVAGIISEHLRSKTPSIEMMEKIVTDAPNDVVAKAFRESLDEARRSR